MRPWGLNFCWNCRNCQGVTKIKILNAPNQIIYTHRPALTSYAAEKKKLLFKIQKLLVPRWFSQHPSKEEIIPNYVPHFSCDLQKADRSRAGSNHQPYSNQFLPRTKRFTIPFTGRNAVVQFHFRTVNILFWDERRKSSSVLYLLWNKRSLRSSVHENCSQFMNDIIN